MIISPFGREQQHPTRAILTKMLNIKMAYDCAFNNYFNWSCELVQCHLPWLWLCKRVLEEELQEIKSFCDSLQKELETLQTEAYQLEGIHKEKEEWCRKLQFQCDESGEESIRQVQQNKKSDELLEHHRCEIQELKLKHRKQRMRFENQLHQLMEQHKNLHSVFTPESLPDEIRSAEDTKCQLISAEQMKYAQLCRLSEELEEVKKHQQPSPTAADTQEEIAQI